jgi:small-conductance mechanosensitive channel
MLDDKNLWAVWDYSIYGNSALHWIIAAITALATMAALLFVKQLLVRRLGAWSERHGNRWTKAFVDLVARTKPWCLAVVAIYAGSLWLTLHDRTFQLVANITILALLWQAAIWADALLMLAIGRHLRHRMATDATSATTISGLGFLSRVTLWSLVMLLAMSNMGIDVTALVAGLGIGGVALAVAAQHILTDLFASLSIVLDKPFVLGDYIIVGDCQGTVEHIGLKTTRVRSVSGEQLIFSNSDLLQSRIRNYKRMQDRRILFVLGVTYQTSPEKLAQIPTLLEEIISAQEHARFDRAFFKEFGDSALKFEVVYYVRKPDYRTYVDVQQAINLEIFRRFAEAEIEFAYPTQTLYLQRAPELAHASN